MSDQTTPTAPDAEPNIPHPTDEAAISQAVEAALAAIEAAGDLNELKEARLAHTGEKSPLSLANRQIGKLDKSEKAVAGKLVGSARGRVNKALAAPDVVKRMQDYGMESLAGTPEQFHAMARAEAKRWGPIIKATGVKLD